MAKFYTANWEARFKLKPENMDCVTMVVVSHPVHGTSTFYLPVDEWQDNIRALLIPYWINNFVVTMFPAQS